MQVSIVGAPTLKRFSDGILKSGFERLGLAVADDATHAQRVIVQIHGAPAARDADREILEYIPVITARCSACIILLHRPDEIRDSLPQLRDVLAALPSTAGVAMLGDLLINDPFYELQGLSRRAIPHGFFDIQAEPVMKPVVIGSHTTWGEMRSIERVLLLLNEVARAASDNVIVGYLGGAPAGDLSNEAVSSILSRLGIAEGFALEELNPDNWQKQLSGVQSNTIFLAPGDPPPGFDVTFNVQLYHYRSAVRLGESSGSLHASAGIPVIFEMNGSERLEDLKTVKVPYATDKEADSADFKVTAKDLARLIVSGEYRELLNHNRERAATWSAKRVAQLYVEYWGDLQG